jgi:hypothetical protein
MAGLVVAMQDSLALIRSNGRWRLEQRFIGHNPVCVAADPGRLERLYCGTWNEELWASDDAGANWHPAGPGIRYDRIMAVAVSPIERRGGYGVVYAGTELSALFRSEDGGRPGSSDRRCWTCRRGRRGATHPGPRRTT